MSNIEKALRYLRTGGSDAFRRTPMPFEEFLPLVTARPHVVIRSIFQLFHDMIKAHVDEGIDEYDGDPESIHYSYYDSSRLFVQGMDSPFFADRLFANRLFNNIDNLRSGAQQNKIYVFQGPHGCGKSTFLNNLLCRLEEYASTEDGQGFEVIWRLDKQLLEGGRPSAPAVLERASGRRGARRASEPGKRSRKASQETPQAVADSAAQEGRLPVGTDRLVEVPCPSHDHPLLIVPKHLRRDFLDDLFENDEFKFNLFTSKEYEWVFQRDPCTICSSLYDVLLERLEDPRRVLDMVYVRPYRFNRRMGEGVTVFNPGDRPLKNNVLTNEMLQKRIDALLGDSNRVRYIYSRLAKTNNGVYALMDIKSHNVQRLIDLHNIISEGLHKVEDAEESVNSLFVAVMNPEDKKNTDEFQSFSDRTIGIHIPYVMDLNTEVEIYRNIFGRHIDERFLPRVLHNFARVIISTRLNVKSEAMSEWIEEAKKYKLYCDENLLLLKMEIYTGHIPPWLSESDLKRFTAKRRRRIIREADSEGVKGFSGRDSIRIFSDFFAHYSKDEKLINMANLYEYFTKRVSKEMKEAVPKEFLNSLMHMYDYAVLQEVKEALYYYNEEEISREIRNYMFAVNFDLGSVCECAYTGDKLEITEEFFEATEKRILGADVEKAARAELRADTQKEYTSRTLPQEIRREGKPVTETKLYHSLHERCVRNLKENVLDPFLENENFRRAIKAFGEDEFKAYDRKIQHDIRFLMDNLCQKYGYTEQSAKEVCSYVVDNDLAKSFKESQTASSD